MKRGAILLTLFGLLAACLVDARNVQLRVRAQQQTAQRALLQAGHSRSAALAGELSVRSLPGGTNSIDLTNPIWADYTYQPNALYAGVNATGYTTNVADAAACAAACQAAATTCEFWAYCPPEATSGCLSAFIVATDTPTGAFPAASCLKSYDASTTSTVYRVEVGSALPWVSGKYAPGAGAAVSGSNCDPAPAPGPGPIDDSSSCHIEPEVLTLPDASDSSVQLDTYISGIATAEACCAACQSTDGCALFSWCDTATADCTKWVTDDGQQASFTITGSSGSPVQFKGGDCLLAKMAPTSQYTAAQWFASPLNWRTSGCPWSAGYVGDSSDGGSALPPAASPPPFVFQKL